MPDAHRDTALVLSECFPFWEHLSARERDALTRHAHPAQAAAGERVQGRASSCAGVVVARTGTLRAYMLGASGKEITLFRVGAGECCVLAASCILPMITFDIMLDAVEDAELLIVDAAFFSSLMRENVYVEAFSYRQTALRFSDCMWVMQQVLFASFDARLATFLLDEAARSASARIVMTHDEMARHLGSAREVVSRMLKYFEREGLVELSRGAVDIKDRARLYALTAS